MIMTEYPMQDVDAMIGADAAREWEKLNTPTDGETLRQAAKSLGYAINELDGAADCVNEAKETLLDTPEGDRIASVLDSMESLLKELKEYQKKWSAA